MSCVGEGRTAGERAAEEDIPSLTSHTTALGEHVSRGGVRTALIARAGRGFAPRESDVPNTKDLHLADLSARRRSFRRGGRAAARARLQHGPAQRLHQQQGGPSSTRRCAHTPITHTVRHRTSQNCATTQDFSPHAAKLDVNVHLRLASTFDSLALILKQPSPVRGSSRMELLEADGFVVLQSFDTPTGLKFFVTADPDSKRLDEVLIRTYELYSDFVLKDPFYELEMPIRCESFDQKLQAADGSPPPMTRRTYFVIRLALGFWHGAFWPRERIRRGGRRRRRRLDGGGLGLRHRRSSRSSARASYSRPAARSDRRSQTGRASPCSCGARRRSASCRTRASRPAAPPRARGRAAGLRRAHTAAVAHAHAHHAVVDRGAHHRRRRGRRPQASTQPRGRPPAAPNTARAPSAPRRPDRRRARPTSRGARGDRREQPPSRACELSARTREMRPGCDPSARASAGERQERICAPSRTVGDRELDRDKSEGWLA